MIANCTDHAPNERASLAWIHTGLVLAAPNSSCLLRVASPDYVTQPGRTKC